MRGHIACAARHAALVAAAALAAGCPNGGRGAAQPYAAPEASAMVAHVQKVGAEARSYFGESTMDYWVGGERVKATVYVMGERGAKVRFNAINPATDTLSADLACDGTDFQFVDYDHDCQLTGLCDRNAIAQLLRVSLEPDDFLLLAVGSTPIIPEPTGTVKWDGKRGAWVVDLVSPGRAWRQQLVLDGDDSDGKWEVLESTVWDASGQVDWRLENRDFRTAKGADGRAFRVPERSKFEQPKQKADLVAVWKERDLNIEIDDAKFKMQMTPGLTVCGQKGSPPTAQPPQAQPPQTEAAPPSARGASPAEPSSP